MKKDEALSLSEKALSDLAEALAAGNSDELQQYLTAMSRFHNYSFSNVMLIVRQRPDATRVAGFNAWKKLERTVKKGEKGICILAPLVKKCEEEEGDGKTKKVFGYRAVHVFDIAQTEGKELPVTNEISGDPGEELAIFRSVIEGMGISVIEEPLGGADDISRGGSIAIDINLTPAEAFCALAHELAHELLHREGDRARMTSTVKELEAESVAFAVCSTIGLENALKHSADYIHSYKGDAELLSKSLVRIQETASLILKKIEDARSSNPQAAGI